MNIKYAIILICLASSIVMDTAPPAMAQNPDDILIVANRDVGVNSISMDELTALFLKQRQTWENGARAIPIHTKDQKLKAKFLKVVLGTSISQNDAYWQEQKIKHGKLKPPEVSNMLKAVFNLKGSVGYIYRRQYIKEVSKILLELHQ